MSELVQRMMGFALGGDLDGLQKELFDLDTIRKRQDKHIGSAKALVEELRALNIAQAERINDQRARMKKMEEQHATMLAAVNQQFIRAQAQHQAELGGLVDENLKLKRKLRGEE